MVPPNHSHNNRECKYINSIFAEQGPYYVRRAYRMSSSSFWLLHKILKPYIDKDPSPTKKHRNGAKNGLITSTVRLSVALRYFAGGRPDDIALVHGISHTEVFRSVWRVVDAVNRCPELSFSFPEDHASQRNLARRFQQNSQADFACCCGAIDGMLIWIEKPSARDCTLSAVGPKKFFCGRKKKFGLNLQGTCDGEGRFLDVFIGHPASTADYLSFTTSTLYTKLESPGFLAPGLCLFGNNAYVNTNYMATPYSAVRSGSKDDYNFYHSQVRIKIECAFGMLVNRWGILRKAIPAAVGIQKTTALVMCLCRLHNFCINERLKNECKTNDISAPLAVDNVEIRVSRGLDFDSGTDPIPHRLLHGGEHFDMVSRTEMRNAMNRGKRWSGGVLPREKLHRLVADKGLKRPMPKEWNVPAKSN